MRFAVATRIGQCERIVQAVSVMAAALVAIAPRPARTQSIRALPFGVGERLEYDVRLNVAGTVGHGSMWIEGPVEVRGSQTFILRSDFQARVGWVRASDRSESWLDPQRMAVLHFEKREQQPRSRTSETVDVFPEQRRWTNVSGDSGTSPATASLDELSFIYYIRTLPLDNDSAYDAGTHFDAKRNPVVVQVLGRTVTRTSAGTFNTIAVEMRVTDPRRYAQQGVIKLFLTDDARRIPVRIESAAPLFGTAVFSLSAYTRAATTAVAAAGRR